MRVEAGQQLGQLVRAQRHAEVPDPTLFVGQHLVRVFLQRELETVEPDIDERRAFASQLASEHVDVERAALGEITHG